MKKIYFALVIMLTCFFAINNAKAQSPFQLSNKDFKSFYFASPKLNNFLNLTSGMPLDAMIGYIVFDSVTKSIHYDSLESFLTRIQNTDTVKVLARYTYTMNDYNPILYKQTFLYSDTTTIKHTDPFYCEGLLQNNFRYSNKFDYLDRLLMLSSYVFKVKVTDILITHDSTAFVAPTEVKVTSQLQKVFKGKKIPECKSEYMNQYKKDLKSDELSNASTFQSADSSDCFQFQYREEQQRLFSDNDKVDFEADSNGNITKNIMKNEDGTTWVQISKEYLVFLQMNNYYSNSNDYYTIRPNILSSSVGNIYPIINGKVKFTDELGYENEVDESILFNTIQNKINAIKTYQLGN